VTAKYQLIEERLRAIEGTPGGRQQGKAATNRRARRVSDVMENLAAEMLRASAAGRIQSIFRGNKARASFQVLRQNKRTQLDEAASKIQAAFRGKTVRGFPERDSDCEEPELKKAPPTILRPRRGAYSAEPNGTWHKKLSTEPTVVHKSHEHRACLLSALRECPFFELMQASAMDAIVGVMKVVQLTSGACVMRQGVSESAAYVILSGEADIYNERTASKNTPSANALFVRRMPDGKFFGEMSMMWAAPRSRSVYARGTLTLGVLERDAFQLLMIQQEMLDRERCEQCLRHMALLETLSDEQIGRLTDAMTQRSFAPGENIVTQGESCKGYFIVIDGECEEIQRFPAVDVKGSSIAEEDRVEHTYLSVGQGIAEGALLEKSSSPTTVKAVTAVECLYLKRDKVERMVGPLADLVRLNYISDPRRHIANFLRAGDSRGPRGMLGGEEPIGERTQWFCIFRPTIRDSIAKLIDGTAVGKGRNIKGKAATRNWLSGYVPFFADQRQYSKKRYRGVKARRASSHLLYHKTCSRKRSSGHGAIVGQGRWASHYGQS
jgi:CRP-like cAMP-binding protein